MVYNLGLVALNCPSPLTGDLTCYGSNMKLIQIKYPLYSNFNVILITVHGPPPQILHILQAAEHGASPLLTGFIISCAPLCVVILSPVFGYYASVIVTAMQF